jgi:LytS/YehU family sensor histidine kinase
MQSLTAPRCWWWATRADGFVLQVLDTGPGLAADHRDGVGLANSRARLAQAWGSEATLQLATGAKAAAPPPLTLPLRGTANSNPRR